jgi:hypothetical protein
VLGADAKEHSVKHAVRVLQHTALLLMQQLQACTEEPDAIPAIEWMDLSEREFIELTVQQQQLLPRAIAVLRLLLANKNATVAQMRAALTPEQYAQYVGSFDWQVSHAESEWENRPEEIDHYLRLVKLGDFFNGAADRAAKRAATSRYAKRYGMNGRTSGAKLRDKAESYYEDALLYLRDDCADIIATLQPWFDRVLDSDPATTKLYEDAAGVPRMRGSRSQHCLDKTRNLWGATKSKHYRQREIIAESVYNMLFAEEEIENLKSVSSNMEL